MVNSKRPHLQRSSFILTLEADVITTILEVTEMDTTAVETADRAAKAAVEEQLLIFHDDLIKLLEITSFHVLLCNFDTSQKAYVHYCQCVITAFPVELLYLIL
jgi:hypothetical protein